METQRRRDAEFRGLSVQGDAGVAKATPEDRGSRISIHSPLRESPGLDHLPKTPKHRKLTVLH